MERAATAIGARKLAGGTNKDEDISAEPRNPVNEVTGKERDADLRLEEAKFLAFPPLHRARI